MKDPTAFPILVSIDALQQMEVEQSQEYTDLIHLYNVNQREGRGEISEYIVQRAKLL